MKWINNWTQHTKYFWGGSFLCLLFLISIFFWLSFNFWPQGVLCRFDWRSSNNHRNLVWKSFFRWLVLRNDNLWKTKKFKFVNLSVICSWRGEMSPVRLQKGIKVQSWICTYKSPKIFQALKQNFQLWICHLIIFFSFVFLRLHLAVDRNYPTDAELIASGCLQSLRLK